MPCGLPHIWLPIRGSFDRHPSQGGAAVKRYSLNSMLCTLGFGLHTGTDLEKSLSLHASFHRQGAFYNTCKTPHDPRQLAGLPESNLSMHALPYRGLSMSPHHTRAPHALAWDTFCEPIAPFPFLPDPSFLALPTKSSAN